MQTKQHTKDIMIVVINNAIDLNECKVLGRLLPPWVDFYKFTEVVDQLNKNGDHINARKNIESLAVAICNYCGLEV